MDPRARLWEDLNVKELKYFSVGDEKPVRGF